MAEFIVLEHQFKIRQTPGDILSTVLSDNSAYIFFNYVQRIWRNWQTRQIVALEAQGSNPCIHPAFWAIAKR